ncbi:MAG TPA: MBL fold metallo-hydrolase [Minicystis sp.]|nr:MBL fold metallo-hydrolase [Minicystis sp.]
MARAGLRLAENVDGPYFVDTSCIDCDLCRQVAPRTFARSDRQAQSIVLRQPEGEAERRRAAMALVACPTSSIGTTDKRGVDEASVAFPEPIDGAERDGVHFSGYASASSYGASSYFVRRARGNFLVDSPRAAKPLLRRLEALGGVRTMLLTHRDDVADHALFARTFAAERVLSTRDVGAGTREVETKLEGDAPVRLDDDLVAIPVPGHTRGSVAYLYRETYLFAGDHLWADEDREGELDAGRSVCWYSWAEQTKSMERLLDFSFTWVLPGHGRRFRASSPEAMRSALLRLVARMKRG